MAIVKINLVTVSKKVQLFDEADDIILSVSGSSDLDISQDEDHELLVRNDNISPRYPNGVTLSANTVVSVGVDGAYNPFSGDRQDLMILLSETIFLT